MNFHLFDDEDEIGECDLEYHPGPVTIGTFEYKGCWSCQHFWPDERVKIMYQSDSIEQSSLEFKNELLERAHKKGGRVFSRQRIKDEDYDEDGNLSKTLDLCWLIKIRKPIKRKMKAQ